MNTFKRGYNTIVSQAKQNVVGFAERAPQDSFNTGLNRNSQSRVAFNPYMLAVVIFYLFLLYLENGFTLMKILMVS
jgi:hypothetical protein